MAMFIQFLILLVHIQYGNKIINVFVFQTFDLYLIQLKGMVKIGLDSLMTR